MHRLGDATCTVDVHGISAHAERLHALVAVSCGRQLGGAAGCELSHGVCAPVSWKLSLFHILAALPDADHVLIRGAVFLGQLFLAP